MPTNTFMQDTSWGSPPADLCVAQPAATPWANPERVRAGFLSVVAATYLASVPFLSYSEKLAASWVPQALGIGVALIWSLTAVATGRRIVWTRPVTWYLVWVFWAASGILVTASPEYFWGRYKTLLKVALMTWVLSQCIRTRADLGCCFFVLGLVSLGVFIEGGDDLARAMGSSEGRGEGYRAQGTLLSNANTLAQFAVIVIAAGLGGLFIYRGLIVRALALLPIPFALYMIAASGSRKGMVSVMLIGVGFYVYQIRKSGASGMSRRFLMFLVGASLIAGSVYFVAKLPFLFRLTGAFQDTDSVQAQPRFQYLIHGMALTARHPVIGTGLGGFALAGIGKGDKGYHYSHSTITETFCTTGIPGFLMYFGGQFVLFRLLRVLRKAHLPKRDAAMVNLCTVLFWILLFYAVLSVSFSDRLMWPLLGGICGYLTHMKQKHVDDIAQVAPLGAV